MGVTPILAHPGSKVLDCRRTRETAPTLLTNTYDAADNRTFVVDSFNGTTTRAYDALNRVTTMMYSGQSANLREDFAYTARDQQSFLTRYSNLAATVTVGTTSMGYDAVGRLTNLQHKDSSNANIANYTHTYDAASRVTTEKLNAGATTTYQYDNTDQLTSDAVVTYSYDANGNRTMSGYTTGPNNQLTSDGTWNYYADKNGNITQKINPSTGEVWNFGYDNRNRLTTVSDTTSAGLQMQGTYTHDALGQRVQKAVWTASSGTTTTSRFAFDNRQIIADLDGSSALTMRYLLGSRILERLARVSSAGVVAWLLTDRLGSIRNVVNSGGSTIDTALFDGFGNIVSQSSPANGGAYLYAGYRVDAETGLFRPDPSTGRVYGPVVGRWWMTDPIGFSGGDMNLWRYVRNSPINLVDPLGLQNKVEKWLENEIDQAFKNLKARGAPFQWEDQRIAKIGDYEFKYKVKYVARLVQGGVLEVQVELEVKPFKITRKIWGKEFVFEFGQFDSALAKFRICPQQQGPKDFRIGKYFGNGDVRVTAGAEIKPKISVGIEGFQATGDVAVKLGIGYGFISGELRIVFSGEGSVGFEVELPFGRKVARKWPFGWAVDVAP